MKLEIVGKNFSKSMRIFFLILPLYLLILVVIINIIFVIVIIELKLYWKMLSKSRHNQQP